MSSPALNADAKQLKLRDVAEAHEELQRTTHLKRRSAQRRRKAVLAAQAAGCTLQEFANILGVSHQRVLRIASGK
ncbi:MAG: hypothetical protein WB507_06140 [Solirubrobacterales bacterium]